jgi:uncharacterized protein YoxC
VDARKNGGNSKTTEKIETQQEIPIDQIFDIDYQKLRESLHTSTQTTLDHLDKLLQGSSKRSNKRLYLELFRALLVDSAQTSESLFFLFEYVTDLRASLLLLSMEIDKASGKTSKEVKHLKTKVNSLLTSPAIVEIGKILQNMQKISDQKKKRLDETSVKEYLR